MLSKLVNVAAGAATCFVAAWPINASADIFNYDCQHQARRFDD